MLNTRLRAAAPRARPPACAALVSVVLLARPVVSQQPPPPSAPSGASWCGDSAIVVSTWQALKAAVADEASRPACIKLESGSYAIDETLNIGNWSIALIAQGDVTLDGGGMHQVIRVIDHAAEDDHATWSSVGIFGLTITNGSAAFGGAIFNSGMLEMSECVLTDNIADRGSAIFNEGTLSMDSCQLRDNTDREAVDDAGAESGGIYNAGGSLTMKSGKVRSARGQAELQFAQVTLNHDAHAVVFPEFRALW